MNGELTEMENVIFYVSYGVLTEFLRMNVILAYFATETATERWKSGMMLIQREQALLNKQQIWCGGAYPNN